MGLFIDGPISYLYVGNDRIKEAYVGSDLVYQLSTTATCRYHVDTGNVQEYEYNVGDECIPSPFTPTKTNCTFVGWRIDTTPSNDVLTSETLPRGGVDLYAVFVGTGTVRFYHQKSTSTYPDNVTTNVSASIYYNNGNTLNSAFPYPEIPDIALYSATWIIDGWGTAHQQTYEITGQPGDSFEESIPLNTTTYRYAIYEKTCGITYDGNGATGGDTPADIGSLHYHTNGNWTIPYDTTIANNGFTYGDFEFVNWLLTRGKNNFYYNPGDAVAIGKDTNFAVSSGYDTPTVYAQWKAQATSEFYAMQDGILQPGYNVSPTNRFYNNMNSVTYIDAPASGTYANCWGISGNTVSNATGCYVELNISMYAFNCNAVEVIYTLATGSGTFNRRMALYGDDSVVSSVTISTGTNRSQTFTFTAGKYEKLRIYMLCQKTTATSSSVLIAACIKSIRVYTQ